MLKAIKYCDFSLKDNNIFIYKKPDSCKSLVIFSSSLSLQIKSEIRYGCIQKIIIINKQTYFGSNFRLSLYN